jgi:hypothetical protein
MVMGYRGKYKPRRYRAVSRSLGGSSSGFLAALIMSIVTSGKKK